MIKKQHFIFFLSKKQRIYDYFYEFASEALHIIIFENFVKSIMFSLSKLKVTPSFCFAFKIPDDPTASSNYLLWSMETFQCCSTTKTVTRNITFVSQINPRLSQGVQKLCWWRFMKLKCIIRSSGLSCIIITGQLTQ